MLEEAVRFAMARKLTTQEHLSKHDREIAAIRKLILTGMKMLTELTAAQKELTAAQKKTDEQLRKTDAQLQTFIRSLQQGGNGHTKRKIDLQ